MGGVKRRHVASAFECEVGSLWNGDYNRKWLFAKLRGEFWHLLLRTNINLLTGRQDIWVPIVQNILQLFTEVNVRLYNIRLSIRTLPKTRASSPTTSETTTLSKKARQKYLFARNQTPPSYLKSFIPFLSTAITRAIERTRNAETSNDAQSVRQKTDKTALRHQRCGCQGIHRKLAQAGGLFPFSPPFTAEEHFGEGEKEKKLPRNNKKSLLTHPFFLS